MAYITPSRGIIFMPTPKRAFGFDRHRTLALDALCEALGATRSEVIKLAVDTLCSIHNVDPEAVQPLLKRLRTVHPADMDPLMPGINPKYDRYPDCGWTATHHFDPGTIPDPDDWRKPFPRK